ncbi:MAG: hypothetical protein SOT81_02385 [Treponema sp.]|nr:hypothetical protein [Treponema sp.]
MARLNEKNAPRHFIFHDRKLSTSPSKNISPRFCVFQTSSKKSSF